MAREIPTERITQLIETYKARFEAEKARFTERFQTNPCTALEWCGEDVAKAQQRFAIAEHITVRTVPSEDGSRKALPLDEALRRAAEYHKDRLRYGGTSSSAFTNAANAARHEAVLEFLGEAEQLLDHVEHVREQWNEKDAAASDELLAPDAPNRMILTDPRLRYVMTEEGLEQLHAEAGFSLIAVRAHVDQAEEAERQRRKVESEKARQARELAKANSCEARVYSSSHSGHDCSKPAKWIVTYPNGKTQRLCGQHKNAETKYSSTSIVVPYVPVTAEQLAEQAVTA